MGMTKATVPDLVRNCCSGNLNSRFINSEIGPLIESIPIPTGDQWRPHFQVLHKERKWKKNQWRSDYLDKILIPKEYFGG